MQVPQTVSAVASVPALSEAFPASQAVHTDDPSTAYFPARQLIQISAPVSENLPATQSSHTVLSVASVPVLSDAFPATHAVHAVAPSNAYFPATQSSHTVSSLASVPVLSDALPATQAVHTDAPANAYFPAPHSLQIRAPVNENLPAAQELHDGCFLPLSLYVPAGHNTGSGHGDEPDQ